MPRKALAGDDGGLGLPGSSGTAVLLGALIMQGWGAPRAAAGDPQRADRLRRAAVVLRQPVRALRPGLAACGVGARLARRPARQPGAGRSFILDLAWAPSMVRAPFSTSTFDYFIFGGRMAGSCAGTATSRPAVVLGSFLGPHATCSWCACIRAFHSEGIWIIFSGARSRHGAACRPALVLGPVGPPAPAAGRREGAAR